MEYRLLGPLEVSEDGRVLELGGAKERTLLAVLLLHANDVVSTARLIDELWGEQPPKSAARLVSTHVWQLRKTLGDAIVTRAPGYVAAVPPRSLDVARFGALVDRAQALDPADAAATLREALALWRGPALEDVRFASLAAEDVARLEDRRLSAVERRIDHDLALGLHEAVVGELQALVASHPYRERFRAQLMLALYRCGRQTEALAMYRDIRRRLTDELGMEPGRELQQLERSILAHEPELEVPAAVGRTPAKARRRVLLLAALVAAVAATGIVAIAASRDARSTVAVGPNAVAFVDPGTGRVVAGVPVGIEPGAIVSGTDAVWVANVADQNVSHIDPGSRRLVRTVPVDGSPTSLVLSQRTLWAVSRFDRTVTTIDLEFGSTRSTTFPSVPAPDQRPRRPTAAALALGRIRVASTDGALLDAHGRTVASLPFPSPDVMFAADALWVAGTHQRGIPSATTPGVIYKLDAVSGEVEAETTVGRQPNGIAVGLGFIWVVNTDDGTLERLDPVTGASLEVIRLGEPPIGIGPSFDPQSVGAGGGLAVGEGSVWVTDGRRNALIRYEPESGRITRIPLDASPADVAVGHGLVWVTLRRAAGG